MEHDDDEEESQNNGGHVANNGDDEGNRAPMRAPKLNRALLAHLDPACFLPALSTGRNL